MEKRSISYWLERYRENETQAGQPSEKASGAGVTISSECHHSVTTFAEWMDLCGEEPGMKTAYQNNNNKPLAQQEKKYENLDGLNLA